MSCHNPHRPVEPGALTNHYRTVCQSCHQDPGCKLPLASRQEKSKDDCIHCHMPRSTTEVPHLAFTHHHIGIHPLRDGLVDDASTDLLIPLSDLSALSEFDRVRSLMLARIEMFLLRGPDFQKSPPGQRLLGQIDEWLKSLSPEAVDVEIEFARMQLSLARGDLRGATQSAARALAFDDIRTEEEAGILGQLGQLEYRQGQFEQARFRFEKLTRLRCNGQDWFYLGACEVKCGQADSAIESFERARQLEPAAIGIYEALAEVRHKHGEFAAERREREAIDQLGRRRRSGSATGFR